MGFAQPRVLGRYALYDEIAAGGMATVHYGRLVGPVGFSRTVAIKRLHERHAKDPEFVSMFLDEARLAARIQHPNVVQTLDVVSMDDELFLVMDYVQGDSLARLVRAAAAEEKPIPLAVVSAIICGTLLGLHAAHEAKDEQGEPLGIVHRDVSPQNILVGADGVPRVLDFGVAKAAGRAQTTREGQLKGKIAYMAQEQLNLTHIDRRADVYATGVVLWEALALKRLYAGENEAGIMARVLQGVPERPSSVTPVPPTVEDIVMRALEYEPSKRFQTAKEMAQALEAAVPMASAPRVAEWVEQLAGGQLAVRRESVARIESISGTGPVPVPQDVDLEPTRSASSAGRSSAGALPWRPGAELSTISSSSRAIQMQGPTPSGRRTGVYLGAGLLVVAAAAYLGAGSARRSPPLEGATPQPATRPSVPLPPSPDVTPSAPPTPPAPAPSVEVAAPPTNHAALPGPRPVAAPQSHAAPRSASSSPAVTAPAPSASCTIKSYLDESGIKHFTKVCE
jgi:serine/threonine-protein kinase